jgi:DNA polymerase-3 subunit epsilon
MQFVAVDVETANADMASICAVGAAVFEQGRISSEWYSLIDPDDYFDPLNVSLHGINENIVLGAPAYKDVADTIDRLICGTTVVTHTHFDRVAIVQAGHRWAIEVPRCTWLDSARVARRTWSECARRGYGLADVCKRIGYVFQHHNALEDAKAAGQVLLAAMAETGLDIEGVLRRVRQPIDSGNASSGSPIKRHGNPDGPLFGEVVVFTGALDIPRREAADLAAAVGCEVVQGVTKATTLLVVGDMDIKRLAGHEKSSKHRKAEELVAKGFPIRIIRETDFRELVALN